MGRSGKSKNISSGIKTTRGAIFENKGSISSPAEHLNDLSPFLQLLLKERDEANSRGDLLLVNSLIDEDIKKEDLSGINFSLAQIKGTSLKDIVFNRPENPKLNSLFDGSFFFQSSIKDSSFSGSSMKQAVFEEAGAIRCHFQDMDFTGVDLSGGGSNRFLDSQFSNASLEEATFSDGDFEGSSFVDCTFSENPNFQGAVLARSAFLSAVLKKPDFIDVSAKESFFGDLHFPDGGFFDRSVLSGAQFNTIRSNRLSFLESDLRKAAFKNSNFQNSRFNQADLRGALFQNVDLECADFTGANLEGTRFLGCALKEAYIPENSGASFS